MADPLNLPGPSRSNLCQMEDITSIGSVPNLADVEDESMTQVYDHYDFTPKKTKLPVEQKRADVSCFECFVHE